jgi:predicted site-specific integrase-resolvase
MLTRVEKARELGVSVMTVDRQRKSGKLDYVIVRHRIWYFPENSGINLSMEMLPSN